MKTPVLTGERWRQALMCLAVGGCAPSILDDCKTSDDCARGICEEGYCVTKPDAAGGGGQVTLVDAAAGGSTGGVRNDAAPPDSAVADAALADAAVEDAAVDAQTPDAAPSDAERPDAALDAARPDAGTPDAAADALLPDAAVGPPVVGECGADTDLFPLYAPSGEPCTTLESAGVWSFEGNYTGHGGGGRALRMDPSDELAPGALTYIESPFDRAAAFVGSDDRWQGASVTSSVRNAGPLSIEAWVRLPQTSQGGAIVSTISECNRDRVTAGWQVGIRRQDDPLGFLVTLEVWDGVDPDRGGEVYFIFDQGIILTPGQWHHVAVVFEGDGQAPERAWGWADGFPLGELDQPHLGPLNDASWLHFGTRANCVVDALEMELDALRILNRALTLEELTATVPPAPPR